MLYDIKKLTQFPAQPGVYLMKNETGEVLYVGKAKNLRIRVKQYFITGRDGRLMVPYLVAKVFDIDTIVVNSEKEALLLESNLIKQHKPRYNALLKDDKSYIALKISTKEKWPTVKIVRYRGTPEADGLYFGPYPSAYAARQTLDLLGRLFPLRQCSDQELARRKRPCILYQMKRCIGPCSDLCTDADYKRHLQRTIKFLRGQDKEVLYDLYDEMNRLSENLEFEKAATIHKTIQHIEKTIEQQNVDRPLGVDADALSIYREGHSVVVSQLLFRGGRLVGSRHFPFEDIAEEDPELLSSFLIQHYSKEIEIPPEILLPIDLSDKEAVEEILQSRREKRVSLHHPQRGEKKILLDMAYTNAEAVFKAKQGDDQLNEKILTELQEKLGLANYPHRIECLDTSNIAGSHAVASLVACTDGKMDKKRYRTYGLNNEGKSDDYAAMKEVLFRRYKRAKEENDLPDLIIVDGGKGQLNIALQIIEELNIVGVDIIGLAKEGGRHDKGVTAEQVFLPQMSDPIMLPKTSSVIFFLQKIRDEAHRFAITFHRKRRSKKTLRSAIDDIDGIGPARRKALLTHFGSLKKIGEATEDELRQVKGITSANVKSIQVFFEKNK